MTIAKHKRLNIISAIDTTRFIIQAFILARIPVMPLVIYSTNSHRQALGNTCSPHQLRSYSNDH